MSNSDQVVAPPRRLLVPFSEVAPLLSVHPQTLRTWQSQGRLPFPSFLIGGKRVVRVSDLEAFVNGLGKPGIDPLAAGATQPDVIPRRRPRGRPRIGGAK